MRFLERRRRQPPSIIIVSLIDILVVLLIFLVATTTFKQHPALRLVLPEARASHEGGRADNLVITVAKDPPYYYLGQTPVTLDQLQRELATRAAQNPDTSVAVRADADSTTGHFVRAVDLVKAAGFKKPVSIYTRPAGR
jgi:biopolymer transport protein ExbD